MTLPDGVESHAFRAFSSPTARPQPSSQSLIASRENNLLQPLPDHCEWVRILRFLGQYADIDVAALGPKEMNTHPERVKQMFVRHSL